MRLGLFGTFDVENYGDLLFPIIAERELRQRLDDLQLVRYSYNAKNAESWPFEVRSLVDLLEDDQAIEALDAILIGGGHLIRFDKLVANQYEPPVPQITHPSGYWLAPALAGIAAGRPVLWNAPGASQELPDWGKPLLTLALDNSAYVSVRDANSLDAVRSAGFRGMCHIVPDTAFAIARRFPLDSLRAHTMEVLSRCGLTGKYLVVQASPALCSMVAALSSATKLFSDFQLVALPIGPILGDDASHLQGILPYARYPASWPTLQEIAGIIGLSSGVIGVSLHLSITALAYGLPVLRPADFTRGKYAILQSSENVYTGGQDHLDGALAFAVAAKMDARSTCSLVGRAQSELTEHWDRIAEVCRQPARFHPSLEKGLKKGFAEANLLLARQEQLTAIRSDPDAEHGVAPTNPDDNQELPQLIQGAETADPRGEQAATGDIAPEYGVPKKGNAVSHSLPTIKPMDMPAPELSEVIKRHDTAVILHLYYPDMWDAMLPYISNLGRQFDFFVTVPPGREGLEQVIRERYPGACILRCENRGRDAAPFLAILAPIIELDYKYLCKIHSKKSPQLNGQGREWSFDMLDKLLGSRKTILRIKRALDQHADWGLIAPQGHVVPHDYFWRQNEHTVTRLARSVGIPTENIAFSFVAGTMFWIRPPILHRLLEMGIRWGDFEPEEGQLDGTLAHAVERLIGLLVNYEGYRIAESGPDGIRLSEIPFQFRIAVSVLRDLEESIASLNSRLAEKDQAVQDLTAQVTGKDQSVQDLTAQVAEKAQAVQDLTARAAEKDQAVQTLTARVEEQEKAVQDLTAQVAEKEQALQDLTARAAENDQAVQALTGQLAQRERSVRALRARVEEGEQALQALTALINDRERALQGLSCHASEQDQAVQALNAQLGEKEQALAALRSQSAELADIKTSLDWRIALLFRRFRLVLAPPSSVRGRFLDSALQATVFRLQAARRDRRARRAFAAITSSGLFDAGWYLQNNPDVAQAKVDPAQHYLEYGGFEGRDPGPGFCSRWYLDTYEDVRNARINPLVHFILHGQKEGRAPVPPPQESPSQMLHESGEFETAADGATPLISRKTLLRAATTIYLFYRRLPLPESFRRRVRLMAEKSFPDAAHRLGVAIYRDLSRRELENGVSAVEALSTSGGRPLSQTPRGEHSGLALCAEIMGLDPPILEAVLIPPPWQLEAEQSSGRPRSASQGPSASDLSNPRFSIILVVDKPPSRFLNGAVKSVREQTYGNWELQVVVNHGRMWNADALATQFTDEEPRIRVKSAALATNPVGVLAKAVAESSGEYVIFLSPYDELDLEALSWAAGEIVASECDLVYCPEDMPSGQPRTALAIDESWQGDEAASDIAFSQFAVWRKAYLESLVPDHRSSPGEALVHVRAALTDQHGPRLARKLNAPCHFSRPMPGRILISLVEKNGQLDLAASSVPLRVLVDARLMHRQTTGTERYIGELLRALSLVSRDYDIELKALAMARPKDPIDGVEFITTRHFEAIQDCHVFHKTFPASDDSTLVEMALAPSVVFTPLDLILYTNPDYFLGEMAYANYRRTMQSAASLADLIIGISNHGKAEIERLLNIPGRMVRSVYLGVNPERFPRRQQGKDRLAHVQVPSNYFLYVGTDYPHKNLLTLLRAFHLVRRRIPEAHLVILGAKYDIRPRPELKELMNRVSDHITHLGHVSDDILPAIYHNARALVYPSLDEGFGLPILEAMLCSTPVVASDATSIPEVGGKEAMILMDGRDEEEMAGAMIRVWKDPALRDRLVSAGHRRAAEFSWGTTATKTIQCYKDAVDNAMAALPHTRTKARLKVIDDLRTPPPTILIVTHIRFFPPAAGNELRLFRLIKYLKKLGYHIAMLVNPIEATSPLDRDGRSALHGYVDYYEEIGDIPADEVGHRSPASEIGSEPILEKWKLTEETFCSNAVLDRAGRLIRQFAPSIILAEYVWMSRIFALAPRESLRVIDAHDMFSRKDKNVAQFGIRDALALTPAEELAFINRCDTLIAIQEAEAEAFRTLQPSCRVITAGVDFEVDRLAANPGAGARAPRLLIIGSGNPMNTHCVKEFLGKAWPTIRKKAPACRLRIVGKVCSSLIINDPNVEMIPYVRDLDAAYEDATIIINPVYAGTGLKIKSAEALGHGKALVCWPEGAAGISVENPVPLRIARNWEELAVSVIELVEYPDKRLELEKAAREFAGSALSDRAVYRELADCLDTFSARELNVLCLYLRYGTSDYRESALELRGWHESKMANARVTTWIIDNKIEGEFDGVDLTTGFRLLSGDNTQREFSGFQKILLQHRKEIESYDVVHFVTSAFNTLFIGYLDYFSMDCLPLIAHRPICLGHLDSYDKPVQIDGSSSQSWIRTCFFFMSPESVYSISGLVSFADERRFVDEDGRFLADNGLSENYKNYIDRWLSGEKMQGVSWHSRIADGRAFQGKTLAILNEHMLSIKLRKAGINLVDFYWLNKEIKQASAAYDFTFPEAMEQLRLRQGRLLGSISQ